jgi:hypothetical protein
MFHTVDMNNISDNLKARLSSAKSVGFRAGPGLRRELEQLARRLSRPGATVTISDILREGVTAYWPQIRSYIRAQARTTMIEPRTYLSIVAAGTRAHRLGLSSREIKSALTQALAAKVRLPRTPEPR